MLIINKKTSKGERKKWYMVKKIIEWLSEMWNIYGGIFLSALLAWVYKFNISYMERTTSFIIMALTLCSVLTILKRGIKTSKNKNTKKTTRIEKATLIQPRVKAIDTAVNTEQAVQELSDTILKTTTILERTMKVMREKIKNFFKRVWGNKATIINITANLLVVAIADYLLFADYLLKFDFVAQNELLFKVLVPILGIIYLVIDIYTTVSKYGWESLQELKVKTEQKKLEKESRLTKEQKEVLKETKDGVKKQLNEAENKLANAETIIKQVDLLRSIGGVPIGDDKIRDYQQALSNKNTLASQIDNLKQTLETLNKALK